MVKRVTQMAVNTLLAFISIEISGLLLGMVTYAIYDCDFSVFTEKANFALLCFLGVILTVVPTAIYAFILTLLLSLMPRQILRPAITIPLSIVMTTAYFWLCLIILGGSWQESFAFFLEIWAFLFPAIAAGIVGTLLLTKKLTRICV